jgi:hypothetical protein
VVGAQPPGEHVDTGERLAVAGQHDCGVEGDEALERRQVLVQAVPVPCPRTRRFQAGEGDDAGQEVVAAHQELGTVGPQREVPGSVPRGDVGREHAASGVDDVAVVDRDDGDPVRPLHDVAHPRCGGGRCPDQVDRDAQRRHHGRATLTALAAPERGHLGPAGQDDRAGAPGDPRGRAEVVGVGVRHHDLLDVVERAPGAGQRGAQALERRR